MPETQVRSALFMDRSYSLGNSIDRWLRRALHVKVGNDAAAGEAIPVYIVDGSLESGTDKNFDVITSTTAGLTQTLVNYTVPVGKLLVLYQVRVCCRLTSEYEVYSNTDLIGSGLLGAAHPSDNYPWIRHRDLLAGQVLKLDFTSASGTDSRTVRVHIQAALYD